MMTKAAFLLFRDNQGAKQLLFVRAKGREFYIFPGGKQEEGETIDEALQRELQEELGVQATEVKKLGLVSGQTPDGRDIEMHLYSGVLQGDPHPQAEIEEISWMDQEEVEKKKDLMTPMTLDHVLPFLAAQNIW
ncbi:MAG: mismatch repair protein MutT [Patescibacteria group bacterium]|nr:mismatch repair protein MutT [Patescibacteria group bacterium]